MMTKTKFGHELKDSKNTLNLWPNVWIPTHQGLGHASGSTSWLLYPLTDFHFNLLDSLFFARITPEDEKCSSKQETQVGVPPLACQAQLRRTRSQGRNTRSTLAACRRLAESPVKKHTHTSSYTHHTRINRNTDTHITHKHRRIMFFAHLQPLLPFRIQDMCWLVYQKIFCSKSHSDSNAYNFACLKRGLKRMNWHY